MPPGRTAVHRFWMIACAAAMLLASGCHGSSAAHAPAVAPSPLATAIVPSLKYAQFEISGTYATSGGSHFTGKRHREHFALGCRSQTLDEELSILSPRDRLCFAILDYQSTPRRNIVCACPLATIDEVSVRGEIRGRRIDERFTYCLCGDGRRAGDDARVILKTHPPFRAGVGGA